MEHVGNRSDIHAGSPAFAPLAPPPATPHAAPPPAAVPLPLAPPPAAPAALRPMLVGPVMAVGLGKSITKRKEAVSAACVLSVWFWMMVRGLATTGDLGSGRITLGAYV